MSKKPCRCTTATEYSNGDWKCMCGKRRFIPLDICGKREPVQAEEQLPVKPLDSPTTNKHGPIGGHAKNNVDCCGVSIDLLLTGIESDCPDCERELCELRAFPANQVVA